MEDLSKWDLANFFTHQEIAALIIGMDPAKVCDVNILQPAIDRVVIAYSNALADFQFGLLIDEKIEKPSLESKHLYSPELLDLPPLKLEQVQHDKTKYDWLNNDEETSIDQQRFSREEIARWLRVNEINSKYAFKKFSKDTKQIEKALSGKERTSLYKLVIGMAIDGYGYNPTDKKSPVTKQISDGLAIHGIEIDADTVRKYLNNSAENVLTNIEKFKKSK